MPVPFIIDCITHHYMEVCELLYMAGHLASKLISVGQALGLGNRALE
jgi:hypothetical protein